MTQKARFPPHSCLQYFLFLHKITIDQSEICYLNLQVGSNKKLSFTILWWSSCFETSKNNEGGQNVPCRTLKIMIRMYQIFTMIKTVRKINDTIKCQGRAYCSLNVKEILRERLRPAYSHF